MVEEKKKARTLEVEVKVIKKPTKLQPRPPKEELLGVVSIPARPPSKTPLPLKRKVVEVALIEPAFREYGEVKHRVRKEIRTPSIIDVVKYVNPLTPLIETFEEVKLIELDKGFAPSARYAVEMLETIRKMFPRPSFKSPTEVNLPEVDIAVKTDVKMVTETLRFVHRVNVLFMQVEEVKPKVLTRETPITVSRAIPKEATELGREEVEEPFERYLHLPTSRLTFERPTLIFAEKPSEDQYNYIELLKRVLKEVYRVSVGGLPQPRDIRTEFEEVKLDVRAGGFVYVLDIDESKIEKETGDGKYGEYIRDRLKELYSQGFGFIILYGEGKELGKVEKLLLEGEEFKIPHPINVSVEEDEALFKLASAMYGLLRSGEASLDAFTVRVEEAFYEKISKIALDPQTALLVEPSKDEENGLGLRGESLVHYGIKGFVVRHLLKSEKIRPEDIATERELADIVVDVYARHPELGDLAVEVETLYGTAIPALKIRKTIESRLIKGLKVWIVVPNPQFVIYLPTIAALRSFYLKRHPGMVEFYTLDLRRERLVSFEEFLKELEALS